MIFWPKEMQKPKTLSELLQADPRVKKLLTNLKNGLWSIDLEEKSKQILHLHQTRLARDLTVGQILKHPAIGQKKLISAFLTNQALRANLVEIKLEVFRLHKSLDTAKELVRVWMVSNYSQQLAQRYKTIGERTSFIDNLLRHANYQLQQLNSLLEYTDLVIQDLDQNYWALKAVADIVKINIGANRETNL